MRKIRIGIDVGGTFTHGVALDAANMEIAARSCVPTTHRAATGVAEGVAQCLTALIREAGVAPEDITTIAHSTTQATNALLEGDVAPVAVIGIGGGVSGWRAKRELNFRAVPVGGGCEVSVTPVFLQPGPVAAELERALTELESKGVKSIVAAQAFSVEKPEGELKIIEAAAARDFTASGTHQISGLYGLRGRTRTAIVNAAILPKMMDAAEKTRRGMTELGVDAPLLIMRSDGGVMDADKVRVRPIETLLSGPAAGISAAILYERLAAGLFIEVGGTSTDISLVLDGKPMRKNAVVGDHALHLKTLDVRTVAAAGGSMPRVAKGKIVDVGPRSAHIAGLCYSCFAEPSELDGATIDPAPPLKGDPDYAIIKTRSGERFAITNTCAANMLGIIPAADYAEGNPESARIALTALAGFLRLQPQDTAKHILRTSTAKLQSRCRALLDEYKCVDAVTLMVGGGGGASTLVPSLAHRMGIRYRQARNAELISAIGVGLALSRTTIERSVVNPTEEDIRRVRAEAAAALAEQGCDPATIEVRVEVDSRRNVVIAEAEGATSLAASRARNRVSAEDAARVAYEETPGATKRPALVFEDTGTFVFRLRVKGRGAQEFEKTIVVDAFGQIKLTRKGCKVFSLAPEDAAARAEAVGAGLLYGDGGVATLPMFLVFGGRVVDLSAVGDAERIGKIIEMEMTENPVFTKFCLIVADG